jgi:hypothetical protein
LTSNDTADAALDGAPKPSTPTTNDAGDGAPSVIVDPPKACPSVGRSCAPAPPADWQGPLIVYENAAPAPPPACPPEMAIARIDGHSGTPSGGVSCSKCGCGPVIGATCTATLDQFTDTGCNTQPTSTGIDGTCKALTTAAGIVAIEVNTTAHDGTCVPTGGGATKDDVAWPSAFRACGAPVLLSDGCDTNEVCVPNPQPPFNKQLCVLHAGSVPCPAPWTELHTAATDIDDTRTCSACTCSKGATNVNCDGTVRYTASSPVCSGAAGADTKDLDLDCFPVVEGASVKLGLGGAITASGGFCPKDGDSMPSGGVAPKDPTTICCIPPSP